MRANGHEMLASAPARQMPCVEPDPNDATVLAELYHSDARALARALARRREAGEAEDLVHDAFARLLRLPQGCAALEVPKTYLRRVAANLLRDRIRSDGRRRSSLHVVADDSTLPVFDPHGQLESRDMLRRVEAAMQRLPDRTREVFVAHRVEGLSYSEIAARTGLSVKRVEKHMSKALVCIDRLLARS